MPPEQATRTPRQNAIRRGGRLAGAGAALLATTGFLGQAALEKAGISIGIAPAAPSGTQTSRAVESVPLAPPAGSDETAAPASEVLYDPKSGEVALLIDGTAYLICEKVHDCLRIHGVNSDTAGVHVDASLGTEMLGVTVRVEKRGMISHEEIRRIVETIRCGGNDHLHIGLRYSLDGGATFLQEPITLMRSPEPRNAQRIALTNGMENRLP